MDYLALYRKYRPKKLDEVVGQGEIKKILANSVVNGTITHAYLFSGPRGTGKTTMAKILAKMVNCEHPVDGNACNECDSCKNILSSNDVIEIDAASNNGVDEIRDLREKANLVPSNAKYKVYIIDEVHMLTTQAFNALLKTLEEPPKHVIFILATTEYYKIPLTITSRCQKFQFNKITIDDIVSRLKEISKLENIDIEYDALVEIAKISDGGMRDSINFLDQVRSFTSKKITIDDVYNVCGSVSSMELVNLFMYLRNNDVENVNLFFENMDESGKNYSKFSTDIISFLKDIILFKKNVNHKYIKTEIEIIKKVSNLFTFDEVFYIMECINNLLDKLKNVSRQSVVVTTNFLIIMYKINNLSTGFMNENDDTKKLKFTDDKKNSEEIKYDMAFDFTSNDQKNISNVNDNIVQSDNNNKKINDFQNDIYFDKNKEIIINNAFAVADKNIKNDLQIKFDKVSDYLTDKKFLNVAGALIDIKIEVAGEKYILFSAMNEAIVHRVYSNFKLCQELLNIIFNDIYTFALITNDEWLKYRDEFISNKKNGIKYKLIKLNDDNILIDSEVNKEPTIVDKLFDLVGEDIVEFK